MLYLSWREILQSFNVWAIISAIVCLFPKKLISLILSFRGTMIISKEFSQPSIISTVLHIFLTLKFAVIYFCSVLSFNEFQNTSHREINFLSKQLYFQSNIDFIEMRAATWSSYFFAIGFFSEHLNVWISYFFLITISW